MIKQSTVSSAPRILVVEDNLVNRKVLIKQIQIMGYRVTGAVNGLEAVEHWRAHPVDLMLMDCQMPVMDGYEATAAVRQAEGDKRAVVIVGLTANAMAGDRQKCIAAGMDDYLAKPAFQEDLARIFDKWFIQNTIQTHKTKQESSVAQPLVQKITSGDRRDFPTPQDLSLSLYSV
ncbi:MAG: response regulator [Limnothrix sp.]